MSPSRPVRFRRGESRAHPRHAGRALAASGVAALLTLAAAANAQVVQLQGGGSSYFNGYGLNASVWGTGYDGWIGAGWQDGVRVGAFSRIRSGRDTVRAGNDVLVLRYPTDIFGGARNLLVQGVTAQGTRGAASGAFFVGASATGLGVPLFAAQKADRPMVAVVASDSLSSRTRVSFTAIGARTQSLAVGATWRDASAATLSAVAGVGANHPFGALSAEWHRPIADVQASWFGAAEGYRRADIPSPAQTRLDGPAAIVTVHPEAWWDVTLTRQTFVRDTVDSAAARATGSSIIVAARNGTTHASVGAYRSDSPGRADYSGFVAVGRLFTDAFAADVYALGTRPTVGAARVNPVLILHERATSRLTLDQLVSVSDGRTTVSLGGSFASAMADVGVGYQIVHTPLDRDHPFVRALTLSLRVGIGAYQAQVGTSVLPTGRVEYDASAATFLYLGAQNGLEPTALQRFDRYLITGVVQDSAGAPVAGAAVALGETLVFTDSEGRFFARFDSRRPRPVSVRLADFLRAGRFTVVSAPATASPTDDQHAPPVVIVLRRASAP